MTKLTKTQLKQNIKKYLKSELEGYGFEYFHADMLFYRLEDEIYKIITFDQTSSGFINIYIHCWVPEFVEGYDMSAFPKKIYGMPTLKEIKNSNGSYSWKGKTIDEFEDTLNGFIDLLDIEVMPWFEKIKTRESLIEYMDINVKEGPRFEDIKNRVLGKT